LKQKKPNKKHRGKTEKQQKKQQQQQQQRGGVHFPGAKNQRFNGGKTPTELRLTLGSFMGLSLGVTRLSLRGTLFLAFRHLTPHLPFLGDNFWAVFCFFCWGKGRKLDISTKKSKQTVFGC